VAGKIERADVAHVARLARLTLTPDEEERMREQLDRILRYIDKLGQLDTTNVEPTAHVVPMTNVYRDDQTRPCWPAEEMLANAPDRSGDFFRVPRIIED
jgi:aspartyl-tRNA(Asn)/glutamyl-tRNA(Gln) amidotransferase subunit C